MKHQVSCKMRFSKQSDRDDVFTYLNGKKPTGEAGDSLSYANELDGSYSVECIFRHGSESERDGVYAYLQGKKGNVISDSTGFIEKHQCKHDDNLSCEGQTRDSWGEELI